MTPKKVLDVSLPQTARMNADSLTRSVKTAEKLYQQGFLSYPRTETDQFDKDFDFHHLIQKQHVDPAWGAFAQGYVTPTITERSEFTMFLVPA